MLKKVKNVGIKKMNIKKPKTFWTCLLLFVFGTVITIISSVITFNISTPLAILGLLTGIGFIVAGYGLWTIKKWGAILGIALCCLIILMKIGFAIQFRAINFFGFIVYIAVLLIIVREWKNLK